ncbi:LamG domain-containing protein [Flavobacterium poyangense]|uniref:LamG domain-containing protein n=1 Tax=Flavobacterium poyangense TaxID=2204302 RepID=UPI001422B0A5|nr:LamG domain-containing protein [Flavobacterium sp. JXAS1]
MKKNKYIFLLFSVAASALFTGCEDSIDKVNSPIPYESIGGFDSSDDVAAGNLVAKFSFDNNLTDSKGNISNPLETNIGYTTGVKGSAYRGSGSEARYFVGNATAAITGLNSFTFSFWMNSANTIAPATPGQGKGAQGIFTIVRPTEFWGGINVFIENPDTAFPDRIRLKFGLENGRDGVAWRGQSAFVNIDGNLNKWVHVVFSYDATKSTVSAYVNGEVAPNLGGFPYAPAAGVKGPATLYADNPGDINNMNNAPKYGEFKMVGTNGKIVFGTHQFATTPPQNNGGPQDWATSYAGLLDEFRIYNAALASNEVRSLYKLEKDNR